MVRTVRRLALTLLVAAAGIVALAGPAMTQVPTSPSVGGPPTIPSFGGPPTTTFGSQSAECLTLEALRGTSTTVSTLPLLPGQVRRDCVLPGQEAADRAAALSALAGPPPVRPWWQVPFLVLRIVGLVGVIITSTITAVRRVRRKRATAA